MSFVWFYGYNSNVVNHWKIGGDKMDAKSTMWYYIVNNQQQGPVDNRKMQQLMQDNIINANTLIWQEGLPNWAPLQSTPLYGIIPVRNMPPAVPQNVPYYRPQTPSQPVSAQSLNQLFMAFWILLAVSIPLSFIVVGAFTAIAAIVIFFILLYRYWEIIQDGNVRTTPGKAVGFSFIPFFNFYWLFTSIYGLAQDMNRYCRERAIPAPVINEQMALWYCILSVCNIIPYLNFLTGIAALVLMIILTNSFTKTAVAIVNSKNNY
jgi:hypothetical protein